MSSRVIRQLIAKDWYFNRKPILLFAIAAAISLLLIAMPSAALFYAGSVLLMTALFFVGAQLVFTSVIYERRNQTLAFVMTLPVSTRDYTTAKILSNVVIFGGSWLLLLIGTVLLILLRDTLPDGLVPYACAVLVQILMAYMLMLLAAIVTETDGWAIAGMVLGSFLLQAVLALLPRQTGVGAAMQGEALVWPPAAVVTLIGQLLLIVVLLLATFWSQARKRDFL